MAVHGGLLRFVDCHVHFWTHATHSWLSTLPSDHPVGDMSSLKADGFPVETYLREAAAVGRLDCNALRTVHVQGPYNAGDAVAETSWLASLSQQHGHPTAIVAYCDLSREDAPAELARHAAASGGRLRGVRQSLWGLHPELPSLHVGPQLLDSPLFASNVAALAAHGLVFELQVAHSEWARVFALCQAIADVTFVVEHCGMPFAADAEACSAGLARLAELPNVLLKLSGFAIFDPEWTFDSVASTVREGVRLFGTRRCMLALDFPVDRLRGSFERWLNAFTYAVTPFGEDAVAALFYENASRTYCVDA